MAIKNKINPHKSLFILAQIGILGLVLAAIFWLMVLGSKERIENDLRTRLDVSTQAMAAQLKVNQVPFSASSVEPGVFIINETDGTMVVDRRNEGDAGQKLWEGYKTKIIYEMQKQKRGWIEYPDKVTWDFSQPQKIIRYISIDELNWILAVEDKKPSSLDLLKESVTPSTCLMIFIIFILGSGALWLMTMQYFGLIKKQISDSLEDNLLSLSGEEKLWSKSQGPEFPPPKAALTSAPAGVEDPIMEEIFHQPPARQPVAPKEIPNEIPKVPPARMVESNDMTVDVQHIHSPVLKKILQQFREK